VSRQVWAGGERRVASGQRRDRRRTVDRRL